MINLPRWVLTSNHPAFYDTDSRTAIEQTARLYGAMQDLIKEHNEFIDKITNQINSYEASTNKDLCEFKKDIITLVNNYTKMIDQKIKLQDKMIQKLIEDIRQSAVDILNELIANGTIIVEPVYNEETEELNFVFKGEVV